jgi:hypothetical protein
MEGIVKTISQLKGVEFKKDTSSWFNGHGYFPLHTYEMLYSKKDWMFKVICEWRVSEFIRSNKNAGNPYSSVYLCSVEASKTGFKENYQFEVSRTSWLRNMVSRANFSIKNTSDYLKERLREMESLKNWYLDSNYPLNNTFQCKTRSNLTTIFTTFNTEFDSSKKILSALDFVEQFCWEINDLEKEKLQPIE